MKWSAVDLWVIGYSLLTSAVALLAGLTPAAYAGSHALHAVAILTALAAARWAPDRGDLWPFLRYGYPIALFGFFYRDTARYVHIVFDHWFDPALIRFEEALLGFNPSAAIARLDWPWLLDFWMFGYSFYYVLAPAGLLVFLILREGELFRRSTVATTAVFMTSYTLFFLFPLEGPRHAMAASLPPAAGVIFFPLVMWIQDHGSIHGGCMPSSHTAVAWVVTYYVHKAHRGAGRVFAFLSALLTVGCVWGRFHYVTDIFVGLGLFAVVVWLVERSKARAQPRSAAARRLASHPVG